MRRPSKLALFYAGLFALACAFPGTSLFSGQVIKQFETYSISESIARNGPDPYSTTLPCDGTIRWVLELPLFAELGAPLVRAFPEVPALAPLFAFALFLWGLARLKRRLSPGGPDLPWVAAAATPVFLRFSTQFLPDPLAVALVAHGAASTLGKRKGLSHALFLAAVSVKPTVLPSIVFFRIALAGDALAPALAPRERVAKALATGARCALYAVPFALWAASVRWKGIPSPMHEGGLLSLGRDLPLLAQGRFYSKFLVWTVFKGVGPALFAFLAIGLASRGKWPADRKALAFWCAGIVPYWLVVRGGNVIHDYYSLSFFLPIAVLCAHLASERLEREGLARKGALALLAIGIAQGAGLFIRSGLSHPPRPVAERPIFCGSEMRSSALQGIPPVHR